MFLEGEQLAETNCLFGRKKSVRATPLGQLFVISTVGPDLHL